MDDRPRLIEVAFPLKQTSIDSVHEKNVRHGHISTLHIWPARRPLAASRAALIATLLPDPGDPVARKELLERIGGKIVRRTEKKKVNGKTVEVVKEETEGGILHWGRESSPDMEWFREEIRKAYGGRAPRVLDPFAGGGAIPLEAMRLGCEATAIDINPVAWFILKCTLEYPQKLAGKRLPLPHFALESPEFMAEFTKATTKTTKKKGGRAKDASIQTQIFAAPEVDLAWHVRAWGHWVLERARRELEKFYPVIDGKPTVAYLWARTVECKNCRATIPLLKTRWLCKKEKKRVLLTMAPSVEGNGIVFGVQSDVPVIGATAAQRREHDKKIGQGTMSKAGVSCPCCPIIMTMDNIRLEGRSGRVDSVLMAVVVDGPSGKEYRTPTVDEHQRSAEAGAVAQLPFDDLPNGFVNEPITTGSIRKGTVSITRWGFDSFNQLFNLRQLLSLGVFAKWSRQARVEMLQGGYPEDWVSALGAYLAATFDRLANQSSAISRWNKGGENIEGTFAIFALPMMWDYAEVNPLGDTSGGYSGALEWVQLAVTHLTSCAINQPPPHLRNQSAVLTAPGGSGAYDVILTDPPYYDAIPYSSLMDFFHVWLRRTCVGAGSEYDRVLDAPTGPKWDETANDGELIDDESRFGGDSSQSKNVYEDGMYRAFCSAHQALAVDGRFVVVFAHKKPDAWETLVGAMIRAGFVVDGSWPIQTERLARGRSLAGAALSSSVWLVCKKRSPSAKPGWDGRVLEEMRDRIYARLRDFWDAGIRGPDFVWSATGPALEAYSKHPIVKKANDPGQVMTVSEFLRHVRRIVVDFVVGRVLTKNGGAESVAGLDDVTTYYLLHRHDFSFADAPAGACILYAVSCGLSDRELADHHDLLARTGGKAQEEDEGDNGAEDANEGDEEEGSGSKVRLKSWEQRRRKGMGYDTEGHPAPLIDQVHRLMLLWKAGDVVKVDEYLDARVLRKNRLFHQLLQALIELSPAGSEERSLLESISNHVAARGLPADRRQLHLEVEG